MRTIEELTQALTADEILEVWLTALEALGVPARSWRKAGVARSILRVVAKSYEGFVLVMVAAIKGGFLDTAEGPWLTRLAFSAFNVVRPTATFASGYVTLTNAGGGVYNPTPYELTFLWEAGKKAYRNTGAFSLNPGETKTVPVEAVEAGAASSAPPGAINKLEAVLPGVTVSNAASVIGSDELPDAELRQLCRDKLAALSLRGPRGAYAYAVRSALRVDGSPVDINRLSVSPQSSTGQVTIYVASPTGAPASSDLDAIRERIELVARPDSVTTSVLPAMSTPFSRTLTVWARAEPGLAAATVKELALAKVVGLQRDWPISGYVKPPSLQGYLYADALAGVVQSAHPAIFDVDGAGADMPLAPGQIASLSITCNVQLVQVPG